MVDVSNAKKQPKPQQSVPNKLTKTVDAVIESTLCQTKLNSPPPLLKASNTNQLNLPSNDLVKFSLVNKSDQDYSFLFPDKSKERNIQNMPSLDEFELKRLDSELQELQDQKQQQFKQLSYLHDDLSPLNGGLMQNDSVFLDTMTQEEKNQELFHALSIFNQANKSEDCKHDLNFFHLKNGKQALIYLFLSEKKNLD